MSVPPISPEDRARIAALAPDLLIETVTRDSGQFNDVLVVNGAWIFRFAKTDAGVASLPGEVAFLRAVAGRLPLTTPEPRYVSLDGAHPGMAYPLAPGVALSREWIAAAPASTQAEIGRTLGGFLRGLHRLDPVLLAGQPIQDGREEWADLYSNFRTHLFPHMRSDARYEVAARFDTFLDGDAEAWTPVPRHGDCGAGNILYDHITGQVVGVIDFGSAGLGDPAVDLAALSTMGGVVEGAALAEYPEAATYRERAAFYRSTFALQQAWYGLRDGSQEDFEQGIARYR